MDNNNNPNYQRPRKRVSRETLRNRQLAALGVIALIVLILVVVMAKACAKDSPKKGGDTNPADVTSSTTTGTATTLDPTFTTTPPTTTAQPTSDPNEVDGFKLDDYTLTIKVGDAPTYSFVRTYPSGSGPEDELWSSSNEAIATVSPNDGYVTAVSPGQCYLTLTSKKDPTKKAYVTIIVTGDTTANQNENNNVTTGDSSQLSNNTTTQLNNNTTTTTEPQQLAEAPAPPRINVEGAHYEGDVLIVNKTYGISSGYAPGGLEATTSEWFQKLCNGAAKDNINIYLSSGYRSYDYQDQIYNNYINLYGQSTADTFSARPGHSEHQTGLAIDVNTIDDTFIGTPEAEWLAAHCWEYGFIIRYPKGKQEITGYKYEPWHIRYVGSEVSKKIHEKGDDYTLEELYGIDSRYR